MQISEEWAEGESADSRVESLMDPLRWAWSSTFGIEIHHSISLSISLYLLLPAVFATL